MADLHPEVLTLIEAGPLQPSDPTHEEAQYESHQAFARRIAEEAVRIEREDFAMLLRRLSARLQLRTNGTKHEQADGSLVASAIDFMRRKGIDLSPLREHRIEQSAIRRRGNP